MSAKSEAAIPCGVEAPMGRHDEDTSASRFRLWLAPPFTIFVFLIHPVICLFRPTWLFSDPGVGWHLATGRYILETGTIPRQEIFSFTAAGKEWINYYWLFETVGGGLVKLGGIPLYATGCMLVYAFLPVMIFRRAVRMGAGMAPAFVLTLLAYIVLLSHSLARPHVVTYLFFAILLEQLDDFRVGRRSPWSLWWLVPLMTLWCNLHGGFVVGLAMTAIFAGVAATRYALFHEIEERRQAIVFGSVLLGMLIATLANPYGPHLHASILHYLGQTSLRYFNEFKSPEFGGSAPISAFEVLVLGVILLVGVRGSRIAWLELALLVFFLHEALHSVRHVNLFAVVAAPILAREITPMTASMWPAFHARWRSVADEQAALRSPLLYFPTVVVGFGCLAVLGALRLPRTLDDVQLSHGAAAFIEAHTERFTRMFNTDNLGGSLIYRFWPTLHVFFDDRVFVYDDDFMTRKYLPVFWGRSQWREVLAEYGITSAVVTSDSASATLFKASPEWEVAFEDDMNTIFFRTRRASIDPGTVLP